MGPGQSWINRRAVASESQGSWYRSRRETDGRLRYRFPTGVRIASHGVNRRRRQPDRGDGRSGRIEGTDGNVEEARRRGAEPRAPDRAREALRSLYQRAPDLTVYTAAGVLGERAAQDAGFEPTVVYDPTAAGDDDSSDPVRPGDPGAAETTADDTRAAVRALLERDVDLVLFVGETAPRSTSPRCSRKRRERRRCSACRPESRSTRRSLASPDRRRPDRRRVRARRAPREVNDIDEAAYPRGRGPVGTAGDRSGPRRAGVAVG